MITIRRAHPNEANDLTEIALSAKGHWGYPERWMELWMPQLTFTSEYFAENESWVAEINGVPVAFCTLLEKEGNAWLENLWVSPLSMGNGLGKRLFAHALELSRRRGFEILQLEADPNAVSFYEKMGMIKIGERVYELEGRPRSIPLLQIRL
jgi:GNAT superfamily N-acetyltransferase